MEGTKQPQHCFGVERYLHVNLFLNRKLHMSVQAFFMELTDVIHLNTLVERRCSSVTMAVHRAPFAGWHLAECCLLPLASNLFDVRNSNGYFLLLLVAGSTRTASCRQVQRTRHQASPRAEAEPIKYISAIHAIVPVMDRPSLTAICGLLKM